MSNLSFRAAVTFFTAVVCWLVPVASASADVALTERNKAVARRVFDEMFNQKRLAVADEIYASDFINHGARREISRAEDLAAARSEVMAFPDLRITVDSMIAEGDYVTVLWTFRGTHKAWGYGGLPPTGTHLQIRGITIWRVIDGKLHDEWSSFNTTGAYVQVFRRFQWVVLGAVLAALFVVWQSGRWFERFRLRRQ